jgi:hypothetical protein
MEKPGTLKEVLEQGAAWDPLALG